MKSENSFFEGRANRPRMNTDGYDEGGFLIADLDLFQV